MSTTQGGINPGDLFAKVTKNADGTYVVVMPAVVYLVQAAKTADILATLSAVT